MFARCNAIISTVLSSRSAATSISLVLLIVLGWLDYITGDYSLIIFYLIPIALAAWSVSRAGGLTFCILSLITRFVADEAATSFTFRFSVLHYWNVCAEFIFLLIMCLLVSALKKSLSKNEITAAGDPTA